MPKFRQVIAGTKTEIYFQRTVLGTCVLPMRRDVKLGPTKFGDQAKPLKGSVEKSYFVPI